MAGAPCRRIEALLVEHAGRFSAEMGIDVDAGAGEVDRWLLGASLFGTRISAAVVVSTYRALDAQGISTVRDIAGCRRDRLIRLLDRGGYVRYDERTASRLRLLAAAVADDFPGGLHAGGASATSM
jgi:hypothetical protein